MAIGDPVHHGPAQPGDHPDHDANNRTTHRQPFIGPPVLDALNPSTAQRGRIRNRAVFAQKRHDFRHSKDAQADNHKL